MIDVSEPRNGRVMEYFRVRSEEVPQIRMVNLSNHVQYQLPSDRFDTQTLLEFCLKYLDGKAKVSIEREMKEVNFHLFFFLKMKTITKIEIKIYFLHLLKNYYIQNKFYYNIQSLNIFVIYSLNCRASQFRKTGTHSQ